MTHTKQTVYLPVKVEEHKNYQIFDLHECEGSYIKTVTEGLGYFFTPEQLNQLLSDVIKDALNTGAKEAKVVKDLGENKEGVPEFEVTECYYDENGYPIYVEEESITNTFEETYLKFKV